MTFDTPDNDSYDAIATSLDAFTSGKSPSTPPPPAENVVAALLSAEKASKRAKKHYAYDQMLGSWRLRCVSGTQKVRTTPSAKPVTRPGKGRYLPELVKIQITYGLGDVEVEGLNVGNVSAEDANVEASASEVAPAIGSVENLVKLGPLQLCLTGPTRFWPATNSLAFDFTNIAVSLGKWTLYNGAVRGGQARNQTFKAQSLKDQAFFTFFYVTEHALAARGKGGGLALWTRILSKH